MKKLLLFITTFIISLFFTQHISAQHIINTSGMTFVPEVLIISPGENVTFINTGGFHNVNGSLAAYPNNPQGFGNAGGAVGPGVMLSNFTFGNPGTYNYHCDQHLPTMVGKIIVTSLSIDSVTTFSTLSNATCDGVADGDITIHLNQTSPPTFVQVELYRLNPNFGLFGLVGTSSGSNLQFNLPLLDSTEYRVDLLDTNDVLIDQLFFNINDPDPLVAQVVGFSNPTSVSNFDGSIDISVSGGTPNTFGSAYTYSWTGPNGFISSSEDVNNLENGTYTCIVIDANGCVDTLVKKIESTLCFQGNIDTSSVTCFNYNDGQIHITGAYGTGTLTYAIDTVPMNDPSFPTQLHANSFYTDLSGLGSWIFCDTCPGDNGQTYVMKKRMDPKPYYYFFTSQDSSCGLGYNTVSGYIYEDSVRQDEVEINRWGEKYNNDTLITFVTPGLPANSDGIIEITVNTGGYPYDTTTNAFLGYSYSWYDNATGLLLPFSTNIASGLLEGNYSVAIQDNGPFACVDTIGDFIIFGSLDSTEAIYVGTASPCSPDTSITNNICPGAQQGKLEVFDLYGYNKYCLVKNDNIGNLIWSTDTIVLDTTILTVDTLSEGEYVITLFDTIIGGPVPPCATNTISFSLKDPRIEGVLTIDEIEQDTICFGTASPIIVNFDNFNPLFDYHYRIANIDPNTGNPTGGLIPGTPVNSNTADSFPAGNYAIMLYYLDSSNTYQSCLTVPGYTYYPHTISEYALSILSVTSNPDSSCNPLGSNGSITIQLDTATNLPLGYTIGSYATIDTASLFFTKDSLPYGHYDIQIEDSKGCLFSLDSSVIVKEVNNLNILTLLNKETCYGNDGEIQITIDTNHSYFPGTLDSTYDYCLLDSNQNPLFTILASGDTMNYYYIDSISGDTMLTNIVDTGYFYTYKFLTAGKYYVHVKTEDACDSIFEFEIEKVIVPEITAVTTMKETCCGFDGSINAIVDPGDATNLSYTITFDTLNIAIDTVNGVYPYMNGINAWPSQAFIDTFLVIQDSAHFVNLTRGYYQIHIIDSLIGCEDAHSNLDIAIDTSLALQLDMQIAFTNMLCYDSINGTVKVLYPNHCYNYQLWLYNDTLNPNLIETDISSSIDSFVYFNELYKGIYGVQAVSHSDYAGCVVRSDTFEILEPEVISYDSPLSSSVYCTNPGTCNGEVWLPNSPTGGVLDTSSITNNAVYKYYINRVNSLVNYFSGPILTDSIFKGLCPGDYEVQVLDGNNCIIRDTVTVLDSSLYIDSFLVTDISCLDSVDATIQVFAHGGREPVYTYVWQDSTHAILDSSLISHIDSLAEGKYIVTIYDSTGCFAIDSTYILPAPNKLELASRIDEYSTEETCIGYSYDGSVAFEIRGGTYPYIFSYSSSDSLIYGSDTADVVYCDTCVSLDGLSFDSVYILNGLTANIYWISMTDINGCVDTVWFPIDSIRVKALNQDNPLLFNNIIYMDSVCYGADSNLISISMDSISSGPFEYSIDSGLVYVTDSMFDNLIANTYHVFVKDIYGCIIDSTIKISEFDSLGITTDFIKPISCFDGSDGSIKVSGVGGVAGYHYEWSTGIADTFSLVENLSKGTYFVRVTDIKNCFAVDTFSIDQPTLLQLIIDTTIDATCSGKNDGLAQISAIGGTPQYTFLWNDAIGTNTALNNELEAGISTCTVTDKNGCENTISVTISEPNPLIIYVLNSTDNDCHGFYQGEFLVGSEGGTPPYKYSIDNEIPQSSPFFDGLAEGSYVLSVVDVNDCQADTIDNIKEPSKIGVLPMITKPWTTCYMTNDGEIKIFVDSARAPYKYEVQMNNTYYDTGYIYNQGDSLILNSLSPGDYSFRVIEDKNGCSSEWYLDMQIKQPDPINADFSLSSSLIIRGNTVDITNLSTPLINDDFPVNEFIWDVTDGNGVYQSETNNTSQDPIVEYLEQGTYTISLTANNNSLSDECASQVSYQIEVEGYDVSNVFTPNNDGVNDFFHFKDEMLEKLYVQIYNRWGVRVYHWEAPQGSWDGNGYNSELLPDGVYFFTMEAVGKNGISYTEKGSVTLIR